jgi:hypothetical protein
VINSLGGEQNNVVFMGRRSFRMEIAEGTRSNQLAIPMSASSVPTARIFASDRERADWESAATLRPATGRSKVSLVALCLTTFVLGIALTLTLNGRAAPGRALSLAPAQPAPAVVPATATAPAAAPEPTMVIQQLPVAAPTDAELLAGFPLAPARRPLAKPARAARPRPVRAARSARGADGEASRETTSADPFADPAPSAKPVAKPWVDPFAE